MRILINKENNDKFKFKKMFLLHSGIIPPSFLPTSRLFCKDATYITRLFFYVTKYFFISDYQSNLTVKILV